MSTVVEDPEIKEIVHVTNSPVIDARSWMNERLDPEERIILANAAIEYRTRMARTYCRQATEARSELLRLKDTLKLAYVINTPRGDVFATTKELAEECATALAQYQSADKKNYQITSIKVSFDPMTKTKYM
jgi:hypothetical protein